jgi:hypothetical protein
MQKRRKHKEKTRRQGLQLAAVGAKLKKKNRREQERQGTRTRWGQPLHLLGVCITLNKKEPKKKTQRISQKLLVY